MLVVAFLIGIFTGLIIGMNVTVVWFDDDTINEQEVKELIEGKDSGNNTPVRQED